MLQEIYNSRKEKLDEIIKNISINVEENFGKFEAADEDEIIDKMGELYNIKLGAICEKIYIQGLKDGINLMQESSINCQKGRTFLTVSCQKSPFFLMLRGCNLYVFYCIFNKSAAKRCNSSLFCLFNLI